MINNKNNTNKKDSTFSFFVKCISFSINKNSSSNEVLTTAGKASKNEISETTRYDWIFSSYNSNPELVLNLEGVKNDSYSVGKMYSIILTECDEKDPDAFVVSSANRVQNQNDKVRFDIDFKNGDSRLSLVFRFRAGTKQDNLTSEAHEAFKIEIRDSNFLNCPMEV